MPKAMEMLPIWKILLQLLYEEKLVQAKIECRILANEISQITPHFNIFIS